VVHSRPEAVVTGYPSIDFIARTTREAGPGWTGVIERLWDGPAFGGCGPNVAVALARLGVAAAVAMVVGDDREGQDYVAHLHRQGVDVRYVAVVAGRPTSRTFLFVPRHGAPSLFFHPGAMDDRVRAPALDLAEVRVVVLTVGPVSYTVDVAHQAATAGVPLAWQLKGDLSAYPPDLLPDLLARSQVVFMNALEARYLCGVLGAGGVHDLVRRGPQTVFVTDGERGCEVVTPAGSAHVPAVPVTAIDPTGAGDAFTAGALAAMLRGWEAPAAARLGAVVASFVVEAWGCQANLPTWAVALDRYQTVFGPPPRTSP
jgi:sugar/nucleoside kinase (ribokinase family)